jgi:hypothetical protein
MVSTSAILGGALEHQSFLDAVNDEIRARLAGPEESVPLAAWFVCECGAVGCLELVRMSAAQFDAWREADEPLLAPGHTVTVAASEPREAELLRARAREGLRNEQSRRDLADLVTAVRQLFVVDRMPVEEILARVLMAVSSATENGAELQPPAPSA